VNFLRLTATALLLIGAVAVIVLYGWVDADYGWYILPIMYAMRRIG